MTNPVPPPPPMPIPPPPGGTAISASEGSSRPPSQAVSAVPPPPPSGQAFQSSPSPERLSWTLTASDVQLYEGSDAETYNELLEKISTTVRPKDIVERIWISDVVYHQMEIHKLRRLKANLPKAAMPNALVEVFSLVANLGNWHSNRKDNHNLTAAEMLVRDWYRHKCPAIDNAAEYRPTQPDLSAEPIKARAFANELANLAH